MLDRAGQRGDLRLCPFDGRTVTPLAEPVPPGTFRVEVDARWPVTRMSPYVGLDAIGERSQGAGVGDRKKRVIRRS